MEAGKAADCYGCVTNHAIGQADAEQAYIQADIEGIATWVALPPEAWPDSWYVGKGEEKKPRYQKPVILLKKGFYGHPDSGTLWEKHCNKVVVKAGFRVIPNWPSCFFHDKLKLFLVVYVGDFKMSGPRANLSAGWSQ